MFVSGFVSVHLQLQNIEFSDQLQIGGYKPVSQCWGSSGGGGGGGALRFVNLKNRFVKQSSYFAVRMIVKLSLVIVRLTHFFDRRCSVVSLSPIAENY